MDHHIHAAITEGLRQRGVDVLTAHEDGAAQLDDEELLARATQLGRVLFSQDEDLLTLIHRYPILKTRKFLVWLAVRHRYRCMLADTVQGDIYHGLQRFHP